MFLVGDCLIGQHAELTTAGCYLRSCDNNIE